MRIEFLGKHCPVCRGAFKENDNVVVCPECGTPHHRECYAKENKCGLESYHAAGFVWNGYLPDEEIPKQTEEIKIDIEKNGADPTDNINIDPNAGFIKHLDDSEIGDDGVSMKELMAYTSRSLFHYAQAFMVIRGWNGIKKRKTFFNISSGLFVPIFQFYRKMDLLGIIMTVVMLIPSLIMALSGSNFENNPAFYYFFNFLSIAEQILLCLFGDYLYYRHAVRKIRSIREKYKGNTNSDEYYETLEFAGRPSFLRAVVGMLLIAFAMSVIFYAAPTV